MPAARGDGRRDSVAGARFAEVARMQPQVELRDVEAEDLDHPLESRDSTVGDPATAVRREALADRTQVVEQVGRAGIGVVAEPPPHERELPAIRLELVARADLRRVFGQRFLVACERRLELVRHAHERTGRGDLDRERAHLVAVAAQSAARRALVERLGDRRGPGRRVAVHVAADPEPNASGGGAPGSARASRAADPWPRRSGCARRTRARGGSRR